VKKLKRPIRWILNSLIAICLILLAAHFCMPLFGLYFNFSNSQPLGLYRQISDDPATIRRGDLVRICLDGEIADLTASRGYVEMVWLDTSCRHQLRPLLKTVAGLPGDLIHINAEGVHVNGVLIANSRPLAQDGSHHLMPQQPADSIVADGMLWLAAPNPHSWDSRHFGAVPLAGVRGIMRPFITFGDNQ
jgi:conjugative transfer signal peptidase traF